MKKNIILIGMPGCGKTSFGYCLAQHLQLPFYDADQVLEEREQRSIKSFFAESEDAFRQAETRTLAFLAQLDGAVIATGGGAVKREENMRLVKQRGEVVFIDRSPEQILQDLQAEDRPLLAADKQRIYTLYEERLALYRRYADYITANDSSFEQTLEQLLAVAAQIRNTEEEA